MDAMAMKEFEGVLMDLGEYRSVLRTGFGFMRRYK